MLSAGDAALVRRGAALFDLARARRSIIHGDLASARQTLERSMDSVPEAAFGAVADDFVAAGGSETVLGNWLRNLARQDDFGHCLIKAFGSAVRIGDIFDRLSPASCYAIISVMPVTAYADVAKVRLFNEARSLPVMLRWAKFVLPIGHDAMPLRMTEPYLGAKLPERRSMSGIRAAGTGVSSA